MATKAAAGGQPAELGDYVVDRTTGYEGTLVAICHHFLGSPRAAVQAHGLMHAGLPSDPYWCELERLDVVRRLVPEGL